MANTNLGKNKQGYGYKYTDLAAVHEYLEENNYRYYQYIETDEHGNDYVITVPIFDGKEQAPRRGCRIVQATLSGKSNPAQEQGSALTYARRYSLLMAFGLTTEDDDAEKLTKKKEAPVKPIQTVQGGATAEQIKTITEELSRTGVKEHQILESFKVKSVPEMTAAQAEACIIKLTNMKTKGE